MSTTPPKKPSNNPFMNFLSTIFNLITNSRLANFAQIYPFLIPLLLGLFTFIVGFNSSALFSQGMNKNFQNQVCQSYETLVRKRLRIEGHEDVSIRTSPVYNKNNSNINQLLPFSCEYTILEGTKNLEAKEISIELNPLFPDLINDIYDDKVEQKIEMEKVCEHETIKKQMEEWSTKKGNYREGDQIVPGKPELLKSKKGLYPVFRWVCNYEISKPETQQNGLQERSNYNIDLNLENYCQKKAEDDGGTGRIKPTHHNYKDPYSLYCVNPYYPKTLKSPPTDTAHCK